MRSYIFPIMAAALLSASGVSAQSSAVGAWVAIYTVGGNQVDKVFVEWQKGGTALQSNSHAPNAGNLMVGNWQRTRKTLSAFLSGWRYDNGTLNGYFTKTETNTLKDDAYTGVFDLKIFDLNGNLLTEVAGQVAGSRLSP